MSIGLCIFFFLEQNDYVENTVKVKIAHNAYVS